ncbi:Gp153 [Mycolicibacterium fortuitum]|uniref:Gp153 n=1 Tax=Mycolicibacterium fortuitum TaxID=1766 RepID=A0A378UYE4_MYCFO|nr:Gp153 [Mycolicibacterium fortuitum]
MTTAAQHGPDEATFPFEWTQDLILNLEIQKAWEQRRIPFDLTGDAAENTRRFREWRDTPRPRRTRRYNGSESPSGRVQAWAGAVFDGEVDKTATAPVGTRNDTLNKCALRLYRVALAGVQDEDGVTDALTDAALQAGLCDREIRSTLASARRKADEEGPATDVPEEPVYVITEIDPAQIDTGSATTDPEPAPAWQFVDGASFILDIPAVTPANWGAGHEVLWAQGESLMIAGPMGLGKTTLTLRLLRARLGLGDGTLFGYPVAPCEGTILYLAMDRPAQIARAAYRMFHESEREALRRVKFWPGPPPFDIAKHPGTLTALAEAANADDVYLDSVKDAAIGLSEDEVGAGYNRARQQLLATGRQLTECHHTTKRGQGGGPPTAVADIYGSAWIANGTGSILLLAGEPGDPIVGMRHVRAPADEVGPFQLLHDQQAGLLTVHHNTDLVELARLKAADGLTAREAAAALFTTDNPTAAQKEKARRRLAKLASDGHLIAVEGAAGGTHGGTSAAWFPDGRQP